MDPPKIHLGALRALKKYPKGNIFSQSDIRIHFKEYGLWGAVFGLQDPLTNFYCIQKVSIPIYFIHGTRWCVQKNPNFTHLLNEHFFGTPCIPIKGLDYIISFISALDG